MSLIKSLLQIIPDLLMLFLGIAGSIFFFFLSPFLHLVGLIKTKQFPEPKTIVITGASYGIGRSLALKYAEKGKVIGITGRNRSRLDEVAKKITAQGAIVEIGEIDVSNKVGMMKWLTQLDKKSPVDLIIANAGASEFTVSDDLAYEEKAYELVNTNVIGVLNTVLPLLPTMRSRLHGQIVIVGSLSTYFLQLFPSYVGSKCWVRGYATTLRQELAPYGIGVSLISPGFVQTGMTEKLPASIQRPFIIGPEASAVYFQKGISENKAHITDNLGTLSIGQFLYQIPLNLKDGLFHISRYIYPSGVYDMFSSEKASSSKKSN